jgi:hypothetical protein
MRPRRPSSGRPSAVTWLIPAMSSSQLRNSYSDYMQVLEIEKADVEISVNGTSWVRKHGWGPGGYPIRPRTTILNLTNDLAGATSFKVRFHYYNASYDWYWAIDNLRVFCEDPSLGIEEYRLYLPLVLRMQ